MNTPPWMRLAALVITISAGLVAVAMIPLIGNQRAEQADRQMRAERQARFVAIGRDAREVGDVAMASQAFAAAVDIDPTAAEPRAALADAHAAQMLADPNAINDNNAARLQLEFSEALVEGRQVLAGTLTAFVLPRHVLDPAK